MLKNNKYEIDDIDLEDNQNFKYEINKINDSIIDMKSFLVKIFNQITNDLILNDKRKNENDYLKNKNYDQIKSQNKYLKQNQKQYNYNSKINKLNINIEKLNTYNQNYLYQCNKIIVNRNKLLYYNYFKILKYRQIIISLKRLNNDINFIEKIEQNDININNKNFQTSQSKMIENNHDKTSETINISNLNQTNLNQTFQKQVDDSIQLQIITDNPTHHTKNNLISNYKDPIIDQKINIEKNQSIVEKNIQTSDFNCTKIENKRDQTANDLIQSKDIFMSKSDILQPDSSFDSRILPYDLKKNSKKGGLSKLKLLNLNLNSMNNILKAKIENNMQDQLRTVVKFEADEYLGICAVIDYKLKIIHMHEDIFGTQFNSHLTDEQKEDMLIMIERMMNHNISQMFETPISIFDKLNKKVNLLISLKMIKNNFFPDKPFFLVYLKYYEKNIWQIIEPSSIFQISWTIMILFVISTLLFWLPYDISFGGNQIFNNQIDNISLVIFSIDIILNFFVTQEYEGNKVEDLNLIIINQLQGWFTVDLLSTIPFEMFLDINFSTNFIKSLKIVKLIKLLRLLKIDILNIITIDFFSKNDYGKEIIQIQRHNRGFLSLIKNNFQIIIACHQYTVAFYQIKINQFTLDNNPEQWLRNQFQYGKETQNSSDVYFFLMQENIKISLGLGQMISQDWQEIMLSLVWMFTGLSLFGQGIGNISAYLGYANQQEIEQQNAITYFTDLCSTSNIEIRTQQLIMIDIEKHFEKYGDKEFIEKGKILSSNVFYQLETNLYRNQVNSFNLFKRLNIKTVRLLKANCLYGQDKNVIRSNTIINNIQMIIKGQIKIQDDEMSLQNVQGPHEIFGMDQFKKLVLKKQNNDLEEKLTDPALSSKVNRRASNLREKVLSLCDGNDIYKGIEDENAKVTFPHFAIGSEDVKYISISQDILQDLMLQDEASFMKIQEYSRNDLELIGFEDTNTQDKNIEQCSTSKNFILIALINGYIWDCNQLFSDQVDNRFEVKGQSIYSILDFKEIGVEFENIKDVLKKGQQKLIFNNQNINVITQFKNFIIREDDNQKTKYFRLKKSLLESQIIEFELVTKE